MHGKLNNLVRVMIAVLIMLATVLMSVGERSIRLSATSLAVLAVSGPRTALDWEIHLRQDPTACAGRDGCFWHQRLRTRVDTN